MCFGYQEISSERSHLPAGRQGEKKKNVSGVVDIEESLCSLWLGFSDDTARNRRR
jgi:hypothetical protein